jgi:hypothetical protein
MWDTPEEEFELKNYFRDHQISMDMFSTNFYDITLLRRFGKMNKMTIANKILIGYGLEFQKYAEIGVGSDPITSFRTFLESDCRTVSINMSLKLSVVTQFRTIASARRSNFGNP